VRTTILAQLLRRFSQAEQKGRDLSKIVIGTAKSVFRQQNSFYLNKKFAKIFFTGFSDYAPKVGRQRMARQRRPRENASRPASNRKSRLCLGLQLKGVGDNAFSPAVCDRALDFGETGSLAVLDVRPIGKNPASALTHTDSSAYSTLRRTF
jgi:hypothetical protein